MSDCSDISDSGILNEIPSGLSVFEQIVHLQGVLACHIDSYASALDALPSGEGLTPAKLELIKVAHRTLSQRLTACTSQTGNLARAFYKPKSTNNNPATASLLQGSEERDE
jgi:hypothetical protein